MKSSAAVEARLRPMIRGRTSKEILSRFARFSYSDFLLALEDLPLTERQRAAAVGRKDEILVEELAMRLIEERKARGWRAEKITRARDPRMGLRAMGRGRKSVERMYFGGDCVLFRENSPRLIVQCKEYLDTIRVKELIGESLLLLETIDSMPHTLDLLPEFVVFANVWELTEEWRTAVAELGLCGYVDDFFVVRQGKRKDRDALPQLDELERFRDYLVQVLAKP